jgi:hypothetical protein
MNIGGKDRTCLVPLAGMLNHHRHAQVSFRKFDENSQNFVMQSLCNINEGQQVFLCYGDFKNRELLQVREFSFE